VESCISWILPDKITQHQLGIAEPSALNQFRRFVNLPICWCR